MHKQLVTTVNDPRYRQCSVSVMDTIADPDITFDEQGRCNYYHLFRRAEKEHLPAAIIAKEQFQAQVNSIKEGGKNLPYDCILGLSGGVDSSYLALLAKENGLRPLAVHFDNGWNSELAVNNIQNIVEKLGFDLYTYVINWDEFKDLQLSYLKASVVDIEAITDHAIIATLYKLAAENGIKCILSGANVQTENTLPPSWIFSKEDHINIKAIHRVYGRVPLKTFPFIDSKVKRYYRGVKGIRSVALLNLVNYNKKKVKEEIEPKIGWRDYGGKHYESIWTRFYQGYILPHKFHIDKRKAHLSDIIFSGQISKPDALEELEKPIYDVAQFKEDYDFVLKKLGLTAEAFESIMTLPPKSHYDFDYEMPLDKRYPFLKPIKNLYRTIFPLKAFTSR